MDQAGGYSRTVKGKCDVDVLLRSGRRAEKVQGSSSKDDEPPNTENVGKLLE
jgi:hypothetical protein